MLAVNNSPARARFTPPAAHQNASTHASSAANARATGERLLAAPTAMSARGRESTAATKLRAPAVGEHRQINEQMEIGDLLRHLKRRRHVPVAAAKLAVHVHKRFSCELAAAACSERRRQPVFLLLACKRGAMICAFRCCCFLNVAAADFAQLFCANAAAAMAICIRSGERLATFCERIKI